MAKLNADVHPSLLETVTENLRRRNVVTIVDFVSTDPIKLTNITGLSHTDVLQVKQYILKKFGGIKKNATQLLAIERNVIPISVTCLDELLRGGLYPGQLCELCGPSASGKTQLCFTIAANVASRSDGIVWYFDTKKDFCRLRYEGIMRARNFEQKIIEDALRSTKIYQTRSSHELIKALRQLVTRNAQQSDNETTYELEDLAEVCRFLTMEYQAVVITVNIITRWNSPGQTDSTDIIPALGKYWARIPATRLMITRLHGEIRKINVWKDLRLIENSSCTVTINDIGVTS
ncbi:DNA repair protein RAD51 like protein 4 [Trachymyrmex zeteki]|uniref:DNA repair protein RAD51 like protein 4 n=1 Tax=Mycetomoellerius zeteki TaxID=64791 RepID=A0A151WHX5_9HYME|nr:DNA repair protein RAD51 like protein 4 [Trachymyrmex zeteki]